RHQCLALSEFRNYLRRVEFRVGPEGLGRRRDRLLIAWREGAQRMLHAVAQLGQNLIRHVDRILRDQIDTDALRSYQTHNLLDFFHQRLRRVVEQQMRFVEKKYQLGFWGIADLW